VDYGCDAFAIAWDPIEQMWLELFSTEIDSLSPSRAFTDGDLLLGGVVVALNGKLIHPFEPVVDEVGLDALDYTGFRDGPAAMQITAISGVDVATLGSDGYAPNDLLDDATPATVKDRPFGYWLEIDGTLPPDALPGFDTNDYQYRIEFKHPSGVWRGILTPEHTHPGDPNWLWELPGLIWPTTIVYSSDTEGWIELADYWRKADRRFLVVWDSREFGNGQSALRIALRNRHTLSTTYSTEVPVYIDNRRPRHSAGAGPDIQLSGGFTDACSIPPDARTITISGEIRDEHFYRFKLNWHENTSGYHAITENYHDQGLVHLDGTGTLPVGTYPILGSVTIPVGVDCGHVYITAKDRTIVGRVTLSPPGLPNDRVEVQLAEWWDHDSADFCFDADAPED
jgi:hypothetical protein